MYPYATGAHESKRDVRDFSYVPYPPHQTGGVKYKIEDILDQHKVGICTAISLVQNAKKATGEEYSPDFQYLLQKTEFDGNWDEGSSIKSALHVAYKFGLLPKYLFDTWVSEKDRKLPYHLYRDKLKKVPKKQIDMFKAIASNHKLAAYASVPIDRDLLANAISEADGGILVRFSLGKEWWTEPIEPLRPPHVFISGHAIVTSNYDGGSFRVANTWGTDWADKGTAYFLLRDYAPTEAWIAYWDKKSPSIEEQEAQRLKLMGKLKDALQSLLALLQK